MQTQSIRLDEHPQILDLYKALEQNGLHKQKEEVQSLVRYIQNAEQQLSAVAEELAGVRRELHFLHNGTVRAKSVPFIVLTSNHTRPLSEALRRRCALPKQNAGRLPARRMRRPVSGKRANRRRCTHSAR